MQYRKKSETVEAFQWTIDKVPDWWVELKGVEVNVATGAAIIPHPDGSTQAMPKDFIINENGIIYAVNPDFFARTYDLLDPARQPHTPVPTPQALSQPAEPMNYPEAAKTYGSQIITLGSQEFKDIPPARYDELQELYRLMNGGQKAKLADRMNALAQAHGFLVGLYGQQFATNQ